ncbi:MAG: Rrf2 family transcriptional regulator [Prosthecobacter sp.]|jgi:Rrf2 family protein|uniref:RrF2 family transcriptional regulator n=1 Tax=Prosthecobacter sp. TaxID=1965333 RepID=UPI0019DB5DE8|nr:Rrf2 family transcriptional regulator [Prosthecobacter sp.]MBE2283472.1 Rrf2 family transcriptional regulator [Prosthecobacter sp.]
MKLSKKAEYALRALVAMGREPEGANFSIQDLSRSEHIPLKFLEQILLALKNGGLLRSKRGVGGGYQLVTRPHRITLGEVVALFDGPFDPLPGAEHAALGDIFGELRQQVNQWFEKHTIAQVIEREQSRESVSFDI